MVLPDITAALTASNHDSSPVKLCNAEENVPCMAKIINQIGSCRKYCAGKLSCWYGLLVGSYLGIALIIAAEDRLHPLEVVGKQGLGGDHPADVPELYRYVGMEHGN